jgi:hypothetical protein
VQEFAERIRIHGGIVKGSQIIQFEPFLAREDNEKRSARISFSNIKYALLF